MPNQRKKGKVHVGAYVPEALLNDLRRLAESQGTDLSGIMRKLISEGLARRGCFNVEDVDKTAR